ncbi:lytic transglycosylase domain-containing protein [Methylomicrobium lacus]|uniref:lytic transglycosylase domain-containing protein n=1 Tax=Methylomicrobium lacus TaxID=136992 RepID=UPI0035A81947
MAYRNMIPPRTAPPQSVYDSATDADTQPRTTLRQNIYRSAAYYGPFQKPYALEPAVEFWRKTYTVWHRSEVAFHDDRYLDVIYEVMVLPGDVDDSLTAEQKEIVNERRDFWKAQLLALESKLRYNVPLNANDRQLIAKLEGSGRQLNGVLNGAAERVRSQRGTRERFMRGLEVSRRYDRRFRKIFRDAGLPEDLACLPHVESSFQTAAKSSAGAVGMWQFTQASARTFMPASHAKSHKQSSRGRHGDKKRRGSSHHHSHKQRHSRRVSHSHRVSHRPRIDPRLDPFASAIGAARYLSHAYGILGDWPTAITSYNHGISGMKRAQNQVGRDFVRIIESYSGPAFGFASRNYYAQFLAALEIANNPMQYFPESVQYKTPWLSRQYLTAE